MLVKLNRMVQTTQNFEVLSIDTIFEDISVTETIVCFMQNIYFKDSHITVFEGITVVRHV